MCKLGKYERADGLITWGCRIEKVTDFRLDTIFYLVNGGNHGKVVKEGSDYYLYIVEISGGFFEKISLGEKRFIEPNREFNWIVQYRNNESSV